MRRHAKASSSGSSRRQGSSLGAVIRGALVTRGPAGDANGSGAPASRVALILAVATGLIAFALPAAATAAVPVVTIDPVTSHSITAAHVSGAFQEGDSDNNTVYYFETSTDGTNWVERPAGIDVRGSVNAASAQLDGTLTGLTADTTYQVRFVAASVGDSGGTSRTAPVFFQTDPAPNAPSLELGAPESISYTSAHLTGSFNPEEGNEDAIVGPVPIVAQLEVNREGHGWNPAGSPLTLEGPEALLTADFPIEAEPTGLLAGADYEFRLTVRYAGLSKSTPPGKFSTLFLPKPAVSDLAVSGVTTTSAHFSAEIDPGDTNPLAATSWHFECTPSCDGLQGGTVPAGASGDELKVANDATGLQPNTAYLVRLFASNAAGEVRQTESFQTPAVGPLVRAWAAGPVASTSADVNAQVNPRGSATVYWFEWGTSDCSANPCASIPAEHDASAGSGQSYVYLLRHLTGLAPSTTYHFRVVARNASGTVAGDDQQFTTAAAEPACANAGMPGTNALPDCRAYELVNPADTAVGDIAPVSYQTYAATGGNAVAFASVVPSGDTQGSGASSYYLAQRTAAEGWHTHAINPSGLHGISLGNIAKANLPGYDTFSSDLSTGVFHTFTSPLATPNVDHLTNIYARHGLLGGPGDDQLLTDSISPPPPLSPDDQNFLFKPIFAAASSDLSHVAFESRMPLTADAPFSFQKRLFEQSPAGLRLVGRVPASGQTECDDSDPLHSCNAAPGSVPAIGTSSYSTFCMSADGSRILFTASEKLYLRVDGQRTYRVNASERSEPAEPQSATAWLISADGSRVFFTTSESLVDEDEDAFSDLYMYEVDKPVGGRLTLLSAVQGAAAVETVFGASEDGHYVYFNGSGTVSPGEPPSFNGLYLWHDGAISFIGSNSTGRNSTRETSSFYAVTKSSRVTPDGRHFLFMSSDAAGLKNFGGFGGYEQNNHDELYLYSADSGRLVCVSCTPGGSGTGAADAVIDTFGEEPPISTSQHLSHALSDAGEAPGRRHQR